MKHRQKGTALIETALLIPVFLLLFMGVADYGRVFYTADIVVQAAEAGAGFGSMNTTNAANNAGMQTAATNAASSISGLTATATSFCTCGPGGSTVSCSSTCVSYGTPAMYVQVKTQATFKTLASFPGLPHSIPLAATSTLRVQ
jgi:Flp pilus assembly protein TadG